MDGKVLAGGNQDDSGRGQQGRHAVQDERGNVSAEALLRDGQRGRELPVRGANVGRASKDLSRVVLSGVRVSDSK